MSDDAELWNLTGLDPGEAWPHLSPDGRFLVVRNSRFKLWSLAGKEPVLIGEGPGHWAAFSPDSRQVAILLPESRVAPLALPSGKRLQELRIAAPPVRAAYHPQSSQLAVSSLAGIELLEMETGKVLAHLPQSGAGSLAWHPNGKRLAVLGGDLNIHVWDVAAGKSTVDLQVPPDPGIQFAFNHTGDVLASAGWSGMLRLWNPQTGKQLFQTPMQMSVSLRFSRDDRRLAAAYPGNGVLRLWEIADVRSCYRTLVRDPVLGRGICCASAVSPDGRLLATAMADGIALWDFSSGKPLTFLPTGVMMRRVRFERSGALLASGHLGLMRWSIEVDRPPAGNVRIGQLERLSLAGRSECMGMSRDGRVVAQAMLWGGMVWNRDSSNPPLRLLHADARYIDVSPDGRWVATGSHLGTKVKIWDAATGTLAHELPVEGSQVLFSTDGRWLRTSYDGNRLWSVETWREVRNIGGSGGAAFSPDGQLLAVETGHGAIRLTNPETGRDYAVLEDPHQDQAHHLEFTPDGMHLMATNSHSNSIHVWNLRSIREKLNAMGLDWDLPPYPPAGVATQALKMVAELSSTPTPSAPRPESPKE